MLNYLLFATFKLILTDHTLTFTRQISTENGKNVLMKNKTTFQLHYIIYFVLDRISNKPFKLIRETLSPY